MTDEQVLTKGRPASAERRAAIIQIAHAAFLEAGYAATSMSAIAAEVGGSKATLYSYFPSKEDLFIAVVETKCDQMLGHVFEADLDSDLAAGLKVIGCRFLERVMEDEAVATYRLVVAESPRFPELGRALYKSGFRRGVSHLAGSLERAMQKGVLRQAEPMTAAEHFFDFCKSGMHHRRLFGIMGEPTAEERAEQVDKAVAIFMAAYGARAGA